MALKFSFTTPIYLKFFNPDWISPDSLVEMAHIGEEVGFDEIAVYDHFLEPPEWQPSYATNSYDPMPLLGFLAAHTERIGIASATINIPYRNPGGDGERTGHHRQALRRPALHRPRGRLSPRGVRHARAGLRQPRRDRRRIPRGDD